MSFSFIEVASSWKAEKSNYVKVSTICVYTEIIECHLTPFFGEQKPITHDTVQEFVNQSLANGFSQKTVKDAVVVIKMIQKYGVRKGYWNLELIFPTYPANDHKKSIPVITKRNQKKLFNHLKANLDLKNLGLIICLFTGIRIGEVCGLMWRDTDLKKGIISIKRTIQRIQIPDEQGNKTSLHIGRPKTSTSERIIPLPTIVLGLMRGFKKDADKESYVLTGTKTPLEPRIYRNYFSKLCKKLRIPKIKFHGLRHTFATRCIESKCDYKTVSAILGHTNISTTLNLYVHPNNSQKKKCIEKMMKDFQ